jgi:hypothetical protein
VSDPASAAAPESIESDIEQTRERLAQSIDILLERTSPKNVVKRQIADVKAFFVDAEGAPRTDNILKVVAGIGGVVGVVVVIRKVAR